MKVDTLVIVAPPVEHVIQEPVAVRVLKNGLRANAQMGMAPSVQDPHAVGDLGHDEPNLGLT